MTTPYAGQWWLAVVTTTGSTAEVRTARRRGLSFARLAELREGVWMRPDNLAVRLPDELGRDVELMAAHPREPAATGWSVCGISRRGRPGPTTCSTGWPTLPPDHPEALAPGFELSASVLRHLQADPLLPEELLPAALARARLRAGLRRVGCPLPGHLAGVEPGLNQAAWDWEIQVAYISA